MWTHINRPLFVYHSQFDTQRVVNDVLQGWSMSYTIFRPYENIFVKQSKHKDQHPIYDSSPSYFGNFLLSCKTYLNLYLKWAMTFRSPPLSFFGFFFFFEKKKWPSYISTIKVFYLSRCKAHLECSLSSLMRVFLLVSKGLVN